MRAYVTVTESHCSASIKEEPDSVPVSVSRDLYTFLKLAHGILWLKSEPPESMIAERINEGVARIAGEGVLSPDRRLKLLLESRKNPAGSRASRKELEGIARKSVRIAKDIKDLAGFYDKAAPLEEELVRVVGAVALVS